MNLQFLVVSMRLLAMPWSMAASRLGFAARVEVMVLGDRGITGGEGTQLGAVEGWLAGNSLETLMDMSDMGL